MDRTIEVGHETPIDYDWIEHLTYIDGEGNITFELVEIPTLRTQYNFIWDGRNL